MTLESAQAIYARIQQSHHDDLKKNLMASAVRYAALRVEWALCDAERRRELDATRTRSHNSFIADCDILSREQARSGEDNSWREHLGQERKEIGDFGCYVELFIGLAAR
jgi:hypothetical protein